MLTLLGLRFKYYFGRFISFMRSYGYIIAILVGIIFAYMIFRKSTKTDALTSMWKLVQRERVLHDEYVQKSKRIHEKEVENVTTAGERALQAVRDAEKIADETNQRLDETQKTRIKQIVKKHAAHPELAAKELAETFGFIYAP